MTPRGVYFEPLLREFAKLMEVFPEYCGEGCFDETGNPLSNKSEN